ncbi:peptidase M20 family protein [Tieghemostelium lacteum]|uniref:Peptidase M20 family protein n=1 Tax=Tieghemostelium lacteum TaxID=361077 RepID=A0A151ZHI6_TIELA|nr:peptidase M20 family protein [Tieghemostelium lacteum]|eukprot:KYQ93448.1 peptidase M20 family protein [Tieghemostelium lacteum]
MAKSEKPSTSVFFKKLLKNVLLCTLFIMVYNTITFTSKQPVVEVLPEGHVDSYTSLEDHELAARLGKAITFKTISYSEITDQHLYSEIRNQTLGELSKFHRYLLDTFPLVNKYLKLEYIGDYSLLYEWKGTDPNKKPILLMGHQDVVPIEKLESWQYDPFEGRVADGYIWGRGTMDDKQSVFGILEVIEDLLRQHYKPQRSFYFAFGHDEEVGGGSGAKYIGEHLHKRGIQFEYILDEGLPIMLPPVFPGVTKAIANIGVCEKGAFNLELYVDVTGGHSSMPPRETAIGILSKALSKIESNPVTPQTTHSRRIIDFLGREASLPYRFVFSNLWLFEPLIVRIFSNKPTLDALQRTTTAITIVQGGQKPNVLPYHASAIVNFRVAPGDTTESVMNHIRSVIQDDRVKLREQSLSLDPSPISPTESKSFKLLQSTILQEFPDTIVSASLMIANTDTRWFWPLTENIFRFCPLILENSDLSRFHGINERISIKNYKQIIDFYYHLIKNSDNL